MKMNYLTPVNMTHIKIKDWEQSELAGMWWEKKLLFTVGGNIACFNSYEQKYESLINRETIDLPYNIAIILLVSTPSTQKHLFKRICAFIVLLSIITRIWNQSRCPTSDE